MSRWTAKACSYMSARCEIHPETFLKEQLMLRAVDTLELCLVCEVCWRPQREGAYDVTTQSDLCAKVRTGQH